MTETTQTQRAAEPKARSKSRGICKSPRSDSWVWGVPSFQNETSNEDTNKNTDQEELMKDVEVIINGHRMLSIVAISILFGCISALASLGLGYSYAVATLCYAIGGFLGFVLISANNFLQTNVN